MQQTNTHSLTISCYTPLFASGVKNVVNSICDLDHDIRILTSRFDSGIQIFVLNW